MGIFFAEVLEEAGVPPGVFNVVTSSRDRVAEIAGSTNVADLLEVADYPVPGTWNDSLEFAIDALAKLPRSKISMDAQRVAITAISDSSVQKKRWETELAREAPEGLELALDISAPRPVITPFTLRFLIEDGTPRFDACSAHTEEGRAMILAAAGAAGLEGKASCTLGLGVPSPDWPKAVARGIEAVRQVVHADHRLRRQVGVAPVLHVQAGHRGRRRRARHERRGPRHRHGHAPLIRAVANGLSPSVGAVARRSP